MGNQIKNKSMKKKDFQSTPRVMDDNSFEKPFTNARFAYQTDIKNTGNILPLCHCYYLQPLDADLITVDTTFTEGVRRISDSKETPLNEAKRKSLRKQLKKFTINCVIFVAPLFCFALDIY